MKWKFTYKEFSLLLGILVAVIVMLTLWLKPFTFQSREVLEKPAYSAPKPTLKILLTVAYVTAKALK